MIHQGLAGSLNNYLRNSNNEEFKSVFGKLDGSQWKGGDRLVLKDLAATLPRIADHGTKGFYESETARLLVREMELGGGYVAYEDLKGYRARVRTPIRFECRGSDVYSAPPPSSGGITLDQMMGIAEQYDLKSKGRWSSATNHIMIEAMRRGFANRVLYLGDADFVDIPNHLWTKSFARYLGSTIDPVRATPSESLGPKITDAAEGHETTHFSVVDKSGMAVLNTYTLEAGYGSGVVVRGGGFLLNNEMGDFNLRPGVTDRRGRIGTAANIVEPGKRMLSSMTPTLVAKNKKAYLVTGSPGGRTIINTVFCGTMNVLEFEMNLREAIDAPRTDHEWFPERVSFMGTEYPKYSALVEALRAMGHEIRAAGGQGDANTILIKDGVFIGAADYRLGPQCRSRGA